MSDIKIGRVTHYYDKIGVAIVELVSNMAVGDSVRFSRGGEELFTQTVDSIQVEHANVDSAQSGDIVGLKIIQEVKPGAEVYKVS